METREGRLAALSNGRSVLAGRRLYGRLFLVCVGTWVALGLCDRSAAQPVITEEPQSQAVAPGTIVTISVAAASDLPVRYHWTFNGRALATRKPTLRFRATRYRAGNYQAVVRDSTGQVTTSDPATLQVKARPVFLVQPHNVTVREHDTAVFATVLNNSGPYTSIVWHNDNPREGSHQIPDGIGLEVHEPSLVIPNCLNVDYYNGVYWLAVTNEAGGTVSKKVILTVVPAQ